MRSACDPMFSMALFTVIAGNLFFYFFFKWVSGLMLVTFQPCLMKQELSVYCCILYKTCGTLCLNSLLKAWAFTGNKLDTYRRENESLLV